MTSSIARTGKKGKLAVKTIYSDNGNGNFRIYVGTEKLLLNDTSEPYEVQYGYDTTANGYVQAVVIQPGEVAKRHGNAGPRDLARWQVGVASEFQDSGVETITVSTLESLR